MHSQLRDDAYRRSHKTQALLADESVLSSWTAARGSGLTGTGGALVLTSRRLLFEPLRTPKGLIAPLSKLLGIGSFSDVILDGIDAAGTLEPWSIPLTRIAEVTPVGNEQFRLTDTSTEIWEFRISGSLFTPKGNIANKVARDQAMTAIKAAADQQSPDQQQSGITALDSIEDSMDAALRRAESTGKPAMIDLEPGLRFCVAPDRRFWVKVGQLSDPPELLPHPVEMCGIFDLENEPYTFFMLDTSGLLGGQADLFGALPPLLVHNGRWGWKHEERSIHVSFFLPLPQSGIEIELS